MTCVALHVQLSPLEQKKRKLEDPSLFCMHLYAPIVRLLPQTQQLLAPHCEHSTWITVALLKSTSCKEHLRVTLCGEQALSDTQMLFSSLAEHPILSCESESYRVLSVDLARAPWVAISSWTDFLAPPHHLSLRLHFVTPMLVKSGDEYGAQEDIFPQPWLVFGTLLDRWRDLDGPTLSQHLIPWLQEHGCVVSEYKLHAVPVVVRSAEGPSKTLVGWTGWITYTCLKGYSPHMASLWALARFAVFVGMGAWTERGWGVTQIVEKGR